MEYDYNMLESVFVNYVLSLSGPTKENDAYRQEKSLLIKDIIANAFKAESDILTRVFVFGSFPFKSYHKDSDIDMTVILIDKSSGKILTSYNLELLNRVLNIIENALRSNFTSHRSDEYIERIEADVRLIKCKYEGVSFDISINNFVGLFKLIFMHYIETKFVEPLFYKRTLLLIKTWCYFEGSILGSNIGLLGSYALEILVLYMINSCENKFANELDAFFSFFAVMDDVNWDNEIVTIYGKIDMNVLSKYNLIVDNYLNASESDGKRVINYKEISDFVKQFERFNNIDKVQNFSNQQKQLLIGKNNLYIIDPIYNASNLGKSVNVHNGSRIKGLFNYMKDKCSKIKAIKNIKGSNPYYYINKLLSLFKSVLQTTDADVFKMMLSKPKIVIKSFNNDDKKNYCFYEDGEEDETEQTEFNSKFIIAKNDEEEKKVEDIKIEDTIKDNSEEGKENTNNNNTNAHNNAHNGIKNLKPKTIYLTKRILESLTKIYEHQKEPPQYKYETTTEVSEIENFEKTALI